MLGVTIGGNIGWGKVFFVFVFVFSDKGPWGCCGGEGLRPLLAGMEVGVLHAPPQHPPTVIRAGGIGLGVGP